MRAHALAPVFTAVLVWSTLSMMGCKEKVKYKPEPAYSGPKAELPKVPTLPGVNTFKDGANWTVYGAQHQLGSPRHKMEVDGKQISVVGYVVKVYRPVEPADKAGCIYPTKAHPPTAKEPTPKGVICDVKYEPPHFLIADSKDEKNPAKMITVMGYASSYIQQEMARDTYKKAKIEKKDLEAGLKKDDDYYMDNGYTQKLVILGEPKEGAKVVVSGKFGIRYQQGQGGLRLSPYGIFDVTFSQKGKIEYKEGTEEIMALKEK